MRTIKARQRTLTEVERDGALSPLCLHVFPSFGIGGVPLQMARIINDLGREFRHVVIALDGATSAADYLRRDLDCTVISIQLPKSKFIQSLRMCVAELRSRRPDVLVTCNWGSIEWVAANRLLTQFPHVHHEAGFGKEEAKQQFTRRVLFRRWALRRARVVVPSHTLENIALRNWHVPEASLFYIPVGIDINRFDIANRKSRCSAQPAPLIVGTVAPLRPEKNIARLLRAFSIAKDSADLRLVIAGEGPERRALEQLSAEMGLAALVSFVGHAKPEVILQKFDIFALSSDTEQMPTSVLEAMAMALPVAAVDVGDVREMVAPDNRSFIVSRDDTEALAKAILDLAAPGSGRSDIGLANRARVREQFAHSTMVRRWRAILTGAACAGKGLPASMS